MKTRHRFLEYITLFWIFFAVTFYSIQIVRQFGTDRIYDQINLLLFTVILSRYFRRDIKTLRTREKIRKLINEARSGQ